MKFTTVNQVKNTVKSNYEARYNVICSHLDKPGRALIIVLRQVQLTLEGLLIIEEDPTSETKGNDLEFVRDGYVYDSICDKVGSIEDFRKNFRL